jgi:hypothetical protein
MPGTEREKGLTAQAHLLGFVGLWIGQSRSSKIDETVAGTPQHSLTYPQSGSLLTQPHARLPVVAL